jgi:hypothetical protein
MSYRPVTPTAFRRAAFDLLEVSGTLTTLELKSRLRAQGYWARQHAVSHALARLADDAGWVWADTGRYRIYAANPEDLPALIPTYGPPAGHALTLWLN